MKYINLFCCAKRVQCLKENVAYLSNYVILRGLSDMVFNGKAVKLTLSAFVLGSALVLSNVVPAQTISAAVRPFSLPLAVISLTLMATRSRFKRKRRLLMVPPLSLCVSFLRPLEPK